MCNWGSPVYGILDTIILISLMVLVSVIMPCIVWGSYIFPVVYVVDFVFGDLLRAEDDCENFRERPPRPPDANITSQARLGGPPCKFKQGSEAYRRITLFAALAVLFVTFYFLAKKIKKFQDEISFISAFCGITLAFTFIPYFIYYFFDRTPTWAQLLILIFSIVVWLFFPVLRRRSSLVVVIYLYSYGVYWKVYESTVFGVVEYSDYLFYRLMFGCAIVLWFVPALGALQQRLVHLFNR